MIKVGVIEDQERYRELLKMILGSSEKIQVVFEKGNCKNIIAEVTANTPDLIIMDIDLPGKSGIEGVVELKEVFREIKILMLTVFEDDEKIFAAIKAGANGYLLKKDSPQKILDSIHEVYEGKSAINGLIAKKVLEYFQHPPEIQGLETFQLTKREHEILELLIQGLPYKQIAAKCYISVDTMNTHAKNIFNKLNVHSRAEIAARFRGK